jgi:hypothetical protein
VLLSLLVGFGRHLSYLLMILGIYKDITSAIVVEVEVEVVVVVAVTVGRKWSSHAVVTLTVNAKC